ncbi:MAG: purine-nucleoside phosphorylase [Myxococcales bacterium]|nr:purine-nucleoside phosphorylase [Myxococcales bacterium]
MNDDLWHDVERTRQALIAAGAGAPRVALVLGSGLGAYADTFTSGGSLAYDRIVGLPKPSVAGHGGRFVFGEKAGIRVIAMQGRVHLYEGHSVEQVVHGVRAMGALGAEVLVVTNAAGGIAEHLTPGELMLIEDHLNLTGHNPLAGPVATAERPRFVSMEQAYDRQLLEFARRGAAGPLHAGVYAGLLGPSYETPAEVRMLGRLGADAVGMSTVLEVIAARQLGLRCIGVSCITNRAAGLAGAVLDHDDVQAVAAAAGARLGALLDGVLGALASELEARP